MRPTNKILKTHFVIFSIMLMAFLFGCSATKNIDDSNYTERINELRINLNSDSTNFELLKEYSTLLVISKQNEKAKHYLEKALTISPTDPAMLFNKGLNYEFLNDTLNAIESYSAYESVTQNSEYREMMHGRYLLLSRDALRSNIIKMISNEKLIELDKFSENNLAIFPMDYLGADEKYSALSKGLSEMISIDLGKVKELKILERIRLNTVLDELKLSQSKFANKKTAPRVGKLLSAGKLYNGLVDVVEDELLIEISYWDILNNNRGKVIKRDGALTELFLLEKEIVFEILAQLDIKLSPLQRKEIEYIPTESINAFLAYSRGLALEDDGNFDQAASFFSTAIEIDPSFSSAVTKVAENKSINAGKGNKENILESMEEIEIGSATQSSLIDERLSKIGQTMRSTFSNSIDSRKPVQEGDKGIHELPPPPPPVRK